MKRYLLDTNAVGDFLNHRHGVPQRVAHARSQGAIIGTCEPVVAELCFGVEKSKSRDENRRRLRRGLTRLRCWPLDRLASEEYGRLALAIQLTGQPIGAIDMLIAAIALSVGSCSVVTHDTDFLTVPGLSVEDWRV
jgi:tRNA(fMet)-specific endonuclease VapC